jgi:hypothetical protein
VIKIGVEYRMLVVRGWKALEGCGLTAVQMIVESQEEVLGGHEASQQLWLDSTGQGLSPFMRL